MSHNFLPSLWKTSQHWGLFWEPLVPDLRLKLMSQTCRDPNTGRLGPAPSSSFPPPSSLLPCLFPGESHTKETKQKVSKTSSTGKIIVFITPAHDEDAFLPGVVSSVRMFVCWNCLAGNNVGCVFFSWGNCYNWYLLLLQYVFIIKVLLLLDRWTRVLARLPHSWKFLELNLGSGLPVWGLHLRLCLCVCVCVWLFSHLTCYVNMSVRLYVPCDWPVTSPGRLWLAPAHPQPQWPPRQNDPTVDQRQIPDLFIRS